MQALPLGIIEMDPVSEDAAFASELIVMIDIQIARMLRPQLFNPGDLLPVFTEMRLQRCRETRPAGAAPPPATPGSRWGKARGDGIAQPAALMPAADQRPVCS